tara:strand:+ start:53 stop:331 length:279 start_codon:yes stop_codon:yes gene_type:complete
MRTRIPLTKTGIEGAVRELDNIFNEIKEECQAVIAMVDNPDLSKDIASVLESIAWDLRRSSKAIMFEVDNIRYIASAIEGYEIAESQRTEPR